MLKKKPLRRVDTGPYGSHLSDTETYVYCSNKKHWPQEGEIVEYGMRGYRVTRREVAVHRASKYIAHLEPVYAVRGPIGALPNYKNEKELRDILLRWNALPDGALPDKGAFSTPLGTVTWDPS